MGIVVWVSAGVSVSCLFAICDCICVSGELLWVIALGLLGCVCVLLECLCLVFCLLRLAVLDFVYVLGFYVICWLGYGCLCFCVLVLLVSCLDGFVGCYNIVSVGLFTCVFVGSLEFLLLSLLLDDLLVVIGCSLLRLCFWMWCFCCWLLTCWCEGCLIVLSL